MNHVTKASPGRRERHKQQTRERLLDAAIECFLEKGYDETTVDQIAARADVARATVFNHFPRRSASSPLTWSIGELPGASASTGTRVASQQGRCGDRRSAAPL